MAQVRVRKRGKTFSYIFEAGKVDGKRKVVEKGGFPTKAAAYKAGVEAYNDFIHGNIGITSEAVMLKDFMTNWLDNVVALNVKPTTLQTYRPNAQKQIFPRIGDIKVQDLTPAILDKWLRDLQAAGLSFRYIDGCHALLRQALDYAVYPAQLINSNPASYIKSPKNAPRKIIKRHIISPEQFNTLLEKYPFGTPFYIPLLLLYHTGMRLGDSYVYIYCEPNGHIQRQSKALPANGEKVSLLCVYSNGQLVLRGKITEINPNLTFKTYVHDTVQEQIVKLQEETAANFDKILQTKS